MTAIRKIIHVDMDAFYAAVEQRDNPDLRGKPVVVGGPPQSRGVVATCSYEARPYGVRSGMPCSRAHRLCPDAIFVPPRFDVYRHVSRLIRDIFLEYTDLVEPLSLDEAFLDVTSNKRGLRFATDIAREIKQRILLTTGLTASAGVSYNKFLAKVASDIQKPDGLTVVRPERAAAFIDRLPIRRFFGIGQVTERKMLAAGIRTGADLRLRSREWLVDHFGKAGEFYHLMSLGEDPRPVCPERVRKSLGKEITLDQDTDDLERIHAIIERLSLAVASGLRRYGFQARTVTLKLRYHDFTTITRQVSLDRPPVDGGEIAACVRRLLARTEAGRIKVRLLGVAVSGFYRTESGPIIEEICVDPPAE